MSASIVGIRLWHLRRLQPILHHACVLIKSSNRLFPIASTSAKDGFAQSCQRSVLKVLRLWAFSTSPTISICYQFLSRKIQALTYDTHWA